MRSIYFPLILILYFATNLFSYQVKPVLDLSFDGAVYDSALNHNNIQIFKELYSVDRNGNENQAFYFDGTKDSRLVIPYMRWDEGPSIWHSENSYKKDPNLLMFWIRIDEFLNNGDNSEAIIFEKGNQSPTGTIGLSPEKILLNSMWSDLRRDIETEFKTGIWYHLGFVTDPNTETIRIYRNGFFLKETVATWIPTSNSGLIDLKVGNSILTESKFKGALDDVKYYHTGDVENIIREENDLTPFQRVDSVQVLNLNFNTNLTDSSIVNNKIYKKGGLFVKDRFGNAGKAFAFHNQSDQLSINFEDSTKAFNDFSQFSITSWLKVDSFNESGSVIFQKPNYYRTAESYSPENNISYQISQGFRFFINKYGRLTLLIDKNYELEHRIFFTDGNLKVLPQNEWFHVAGVYDNGDFKLYINGELQPIRHKYISNSNWENIKGSSMIIGSNSTSESTFFGQLDDLTIFDYSISSEEIAEMIDYIEPEKSFEPKELLFLPFDSVNSDSRIIFGDIELDSENFTNDRFNVLKGSYRFKSDLKLLEIKNMDAIYDSVYSGLTVSSWVRIDSLRSFQYEGNYHSTIISRVDQKFSDKFSLGIKNENPYPIYPYSEGSKILFFDLNGITVSTSSIKVQMGYWMHLAGTYDGEKAKLYVNGELVAEQEFKIKLNLSESRIIIGNEENGNAPFFGSMDELRVYNYPIEQEDVRQFYTDRFKGYKIGNKQVVNLVFDNSFVDSSLYNHQFKFEEAQLSYDRFEDLNSALSINGSNSNVYLEDPNSILDSLSSSMTVTMWVKISEDLGQNTTNTLLSRDDGNLNKYSLGLVNEESASNSFGTLVFSIGGIEVKYTDKPIQPGKWFHIAASYDGIKIKLYLNGVLRKEFDYSGIIRVNDSRLNLGNDVNRSTPFNGLIDEVKIYSYALEDSVIASMIDVDVVSVSNEEVFEIPKKVHLHQNFPNPFNPTTQITFSISSPDIVNLTVYDIIGREVKVLINGKLPSGSHQINFNATDLSSGVYIYRLQTSTTVLSKKMTLIK